ncbi:uncharacterized protein LOC119455380 isoform X4 [Dermacentor silvarum]|uniref:uncharacterized protein LOC119455380 isoform X4 n=1 Tax=Dermacentor silvarum TaxID=543639 RepID=UPI0018994460|nr:uncharacterized protein LOC119455380 isoform X4 [Dermacentor silvarum]
MLEDLRRRKHAHVMSASQPPHWGRDPAPKRRCVQRSVGSQPPLVAASPWTTERCSAPGGPAALLPRAAFRAQEHNRFREMELFMRTTPQPLPMLGGLSSQFLPRIKVELPEPPESPLRRLNTDCGVGSLSNNCDDSPLDVRIHPRSPNGSASNGGRCARGSATVGGAPMVDNGEVEEIVASVELADDSTGGDVLEDRNNCTPTGAAAGAARMPYAAAARAVAERQLVELQRLHAEEEHKLKVELLKKQHMVADLQRKYWRMKVKALAQKASSAPSSYHACENKSVEEDESDSPD